MKTSVSNPAGVVTALALIVLLPNASALADGCPAPSFAAPRIFAAGVSPQSVAIGDFNDDGKADLVVANYGSANVSVLLGEGAGNFRAAVNYSARDGPRSVAVGDFNGDGKLDLAVANEGTLQNKLADGGIWILLGNGDGTFQTAAHFGAGISPSSLAVGDFNGDGKTDLVVSNLGTYQNQFTNGGVSVLLGRGDGTFQTAANYGAGKGPAFVAVGDLNGDGKLDLAVANASSADVSVLLNKGDGTFESSANYIVTSSHRFVAVGDFNGDGKPDLVVANYGYEANGSVSLLLGNGDGSFQAPSEHPAGLHCWSLATGDFNGDGKPDLVVGNMDPAGAISVLLNKGDGNFQAAVSYSAGRDNSFVAAADLDGDGKPDLVVTDGFHVLVMLGHADGTFDAPVNNAVKGNVYSFATGDFDGNGKLDLAVPYASAYNPNFGTYTNTGIFVLLGNGEGTFQAAINYSGGNPSSIVVDDFNGDGKLDLATGNAGSGDVSILLGNGDGTFRSPVNYGAGKGASFVAVGDLNRDGKPDLVVANYDSGPNFTNGSVSVLLGNGDGTFQAPTNYAAGPHPRSLAIGDFDGDNKPDLAVANLSYLSFGADTVSVLLGKGDGTFKAPVSFPAGRGPQSLAAGDFNGDGKLDLAVADYAPGDWSADFSLSVFLGRGDGTFESPVTFYGVGGYSVVAGDVNGDGRLDLALPGTVLLGNGDGTFQPAVSLGVSGDHVAVGDFNGDGKPDLASIRNVYSSIGYVSVLLNTCASAGTHLSITRSDATTTTLSWPLPYANFVLESATNLGSTNWKGVPKAITTNNGRCEITMPFDLGQRFLRLRKP